MWSSTDFLSTSSASAWRTALSVKVGCLVFMLERSTSTSVHGSVALRCCARTSPGAGPQQEAYPGFDACVAKVMADGKVPGLSLAIVRNDSLIYVKGYGVKEIGKPDKVDENTLFEIGSTTKTFTSALVGIMQTDGKLRFDDRISAHLPDFRLYDPYASAEVTIRDALSHRTGLARGELMWLASGLSRLEIIHRLRFQPPATSFRSAYAYNNPMVVVAGEVAAKAGGSTWEDLIQQRILTPLGMTRST